MADLSWVFQVRCPSCGHQHQQWGREGTERPSEIKCHCDARFSIAYLTREALYETVWSEPVSRLAEKYAISGVGLTKLCRRAGVPVPPVGYWQQKAYGRAPERQSLAAAPETFREPIALRLRSPDLEPPPRPPDVEALIAQEDSAPRRVQVPDELRSPHPLVQRAGHLLRAAKPDESGIVRPPWSEGCLDIAVAKENVRRSLRIMNALAKAVEARGWSIKLGEGRDQGTHVSVLGHAVRFGLVERTTRSEHVATKIDQEDLRKYGRTWAVKWDYRPSGLLEVRLKETAGRGLRRAWVDAKNKPLEEQLNAVLVGIVLVAEAKRAERAAAERRQREWQEAERRRVEAEARRREEAERLARLEAEAAAWSQSQRLRAYTDAVERDASDRGIPVEPGTEVYRWLEWARAHADRLDPIKASKT